MPLVYSKTLWPDIIGQKYSRTPVFTTIRSDYGSAGDQRRSIAGVLYRFKLGWTSLVDDDASQLLEAVNSLADSWGTMVFFEWDALQWNGVSLGTTTGSGSTTFTLPAKSVTGLVVTDNGSPVSVTLNPGAGTNGEDTVTYTSPGSGHVMVSSFSGRHRRTVTVEAQSIRLTDRPGGSNLWQADVTLLEF